MSVTSETSALSEAARGLFMTLQSTVEVARDRVALVSQNLWMKRPPLAEHVAEVLARADFVIVQSQQVEMSSALVERIRELRAALAAETAPIAVTVTDAKKAG